MTAREFADEIPTLINELNSFAMERKWTYSANKLVLATLGELGELADLLKFKENNSFFDYSELDKIGQEVADVTIYLLRLVQNCEVVEEVYFKLIA